ncbi:MAG: hypothetical protein JXA33_24745 [Anaerolineae bacterium]|nr:hypothetical protein [Anaerolineae bacterium]
MRKTLNNRLKMLFGTWLTPLVNLDYTLLLFATFIFHHYYFGEAHAIAAFLAFDAKLLSAIYIYGAIVLLFSLINVPDDWHPFATFMVFIGSAWISIAYTALFWFYFLTPGWLDLLLQCYYVFQAMISLIQIILLLSQKEGERPIIMPHLSGGASFFKTILILAYVVGTTLFLDRQRSLAPGTVTNQVNFFGTLIMQGVPYFVMGIQKTKKWLACTRVRM